AAPGISSGLGSAGIFSKRSAWTLAIMRRRREGTNWPRSPRPGKTIPFHGLGAERLSRLLLLKEMTQRSRLRRLDPVRDFHEMSAQRREVLVIYKPMIARYG